MNAGAIQKGLIMNELNDKTNNKHKIRGFSPNKIRFN
mgnify:CR=1 FL=1